MNLPIFYIPVAGTRGWSDDSSSLEQYGVNELRWWQDNSFFHRFMQRHGFDLPCPLDPFVWSTDLNGAAFWRRWSILKGLVSRSKDHRDWIAGGAALRWYISYCKVSGVNIIAHSHGLQVAAYAAEQGLLIDKLVSVGSPIRKDMEPIYEGARHNIKKWLHIQDGNNDRIQLAGLFGDGAFSMRRAAKFADHFDTLPNISHSRIVSDPNAFHYWQDLSWLEFLKTGWIKKAKYDKDSILNDSDSSPFER